MMTRNDIAKLGGAKTKLLKEKQTKIKIQNYYLNPTKCLNNNCKNILQYKTFKNKSKYCSKSCAAKINNVLYHKRQKTHKFLNCSICNNKLKTRRTTIAKYRYCSKECRQKHSLERTEILMSKGLLTDNQRDRIKTFIENKFGHKCFICGIKEWMNKPLVLILDHINGDSENNTIDNLRLVCSNCDSQLPTYKSKNKGKGRKNRMKKERFSTSLNKN